jgi:hypothetical protein
MGTRNVLSLHSTRLAKSDLRGPTEELEKLHQGGKLRGAMPLLKLNRINKGGEILINSEKIMFIEVESKATTIHMSDNLLFSVEDPPDSIAIKIEALETARIKNGIQQSGLVGKAS